MDYPWTYKGYRESSTEFCGFPCFFYKTNWEGVTMYKVVIVDDEPIIAEGLARVVDWQSLGCEVMGTAFDAKDGADLIREHEPHILLTDVNMPQVSGLEMLAAIRSEFPLLQVTIISGHGDFHFAQEAMHLGASRYLLKPTKMDEIYEAIGIMLDNIRKQELFQAKQNAAPENIPEVVAEDNTEANSFIISQALSYIREHYMDKLTLPLVAEKCYVSQWHLSKLLNGQLKKTFYEVMNQVRIEHAKELLKDGSLRISDVAEQVGYGEAAHFSRVFKKEMGISANEYRSSLK